MHLCCSEALIHLKALGFLQTIRLFRFWAVALGTAPNPWPAGPSAHELRVALGARHYDIHPDPHGLGGGGHHVVEAVVGLHAEGQRRVWALEGEVENQTPVTASSPQSHELQDQRKCWSC